ncbi:MAG TPA: ABC transporter permease [Thermoanaerobaculia bacterium]
MTTLLRDFRFGLRLLVKRPVFSLVAALTLALGIGANSAIFSVVKGVLLDTLPFDEPEELVFMTERSESFGEMSTSYPNFLDWRARNRVFEHVAAHRSDGYNLTGDGPPELVTAIHASANLFQLLGVDPARGRHFTAEEDQVGGPKVAILTYGLWQRRFGGREDAVGSTLLLDGEPYEVVGVMPRGFLYPIYYRDAELWLPIGHFAADWLEHRGNHPGIYVTARLKDGVDMASAEADMQRVAAELEAQYPDSNTKATVSFFPLQKRMVRNVRPMLMVLLASVAAVLLIACVNVANLLLARGAGRAQEMAVRGALGAGRWRIGRQLLAESVTLALAGGVLGIGVAFASLKGLLAVLELERLPTYGLVAIDGRVLAFTAVVALATGLVFGLVPALQATRSEFVQALKDGSKGSRGPDRHRVQSGLVVAEVALALVLLIGAVLFLRSFSRLLAADPGFDAESVLTFQVTLPEAGYPEEAQQAAFFEQTLERIHGLPGVLSAATTLPLLGGWQSSYVAEGQEPLPPGQGRHTEVMRVTPRYFETMGLRLLRGRTLTSEDHADSRRVAVVDERFAEAMWPGEDAIGKRVKFGRDPADEENPWMEVVGVVNHVKSYGVNEESRVQLYQPMVQGPLPFATVVVKTAVPPRQLVDGVEAQIQALDAAQPIADVMTMEERLAQNVASERLAAVLLGAFAALALVLSAIGIYGVIAYSVAQRRREIGIRMALGARSADVLRLVLGQGLLLVLLGVAAGMGLVILLSPLVASQLYGISPRDPSTLFTLPFVLTLVALAACALPARRASRVQPMLALHYE